MSVRRLAEDSVQPPRFAFEGDNVAWAERTIGKYPEGRQQSAVIPLLMRAQEQDGWVTKAAIEHVAAMLRMPLIRVLEVATFYTQFQLKPVGTRAHIQVCGTTPCMLRGSDDLKRVCKTKIHEEQFQLNASGTLSWEEVECLGACVNAPMIMVFKDTYEDLTPERLEEIIDLFASGEGASVLPGPQNGRHLSAPIGGLTSLTSADTDRPSQQGAGAGRDSSDAVPPSEAGRPKTHAAETDPTIASPGKAANGNVSPSSESVHSVDPAAGAGKPGSGSTGGTSQGPTGAAEKDAAGENAAAAGGGSFTSVAVEANRVSDDILPGPAADEGLPVAPAAEQRTLETDGPKEMGEKPAGLLVSAPVEKDDLKLIRGVGPVLETTLNELGVYHFSQIAAWTPEELIWIDDHLNFRGRAVRDRWIDQARDLLVSGSKQP